MSNLTTQINNLESNWLKTRLANIASRQDLNDDVKTKKMSRSIRNWVAGIAILRFILSIVTLSFIIPFYNMWAKSKGKQSRWFKEPSLTPVKEELAKKTPVSTPNSSPRDTSSEQTEDDQSVASHTETGNTENSHTEEVKPTTGQTGKTEETAQPRGQTGETAQVGESESESDEDQELDTAKFDDFYEPDAVQKIMNNAPNRPQLLRLLFNDVDPRDPQKIEVFAKQLLAVIKMSKKYDSPTIFVAKEPIDANHFICGFFWNNTLLFIDLNGVHDDKNYDRIKVEYHKQLKQDPELKSNVELQDDKSFLRSNRKIQNDRDIPNRSEETGAVSCGPITAEFVKTILTSNDRFELLTWLKHMKEQMTPSNLLDISLIMPPHLEDLVCPTDDKGTNHKELYMRGVLKIRKKHDGILECSQNNSETPEQELFFGLLFGGNLDAVEERIDSALKDRNNYLTPQDLPPVSPTLARFRQKALNPQPAQPNAEPNNSGKHSNQDTQHSPRK